MTSIRIVDKEFRILNRYQHSKSTVNIDKIKNIRSIKSGKYYSIRIIAPWGVTVAYEKKEDKFGSTGISGRITDKKLVKDIISDIKTLVATYK